MLFCNLKCFCFIVNLFIALPFSYLILILNDDYGAHDVKDKVLIQVQRGHMLYEGKQMRMIQLLAPSICRLMVLRQQHYNLIIHR